MPDRRARRSSEVGGGKKKTVYTVRQNVQTRGAAGMSEGQRALERKKKKELERRGLLCSVIGEAKAERWKFDLLKDKEDKEYHSKKTQKRIREN